MNKEELISDYYFLKKIQEKEQIGNDINEISNVTGMYKRQILLAYLYMYDFTLKYDLNDFGEYDRVVIRYLNGENITDICKDFKHLGKELLEHLVSNGFYQLNSFKHIKDYKTELLPGSFITVNRDGELYNQKGNAIKGTPYTSGEQYYRIVYKGRRYHLSKIKSIAIGFLGARMNDIVHPLDGNADNLELSNIALSIKQFDGKTEMSIYRQKRINEAFISSDRIYESYNGSNEEELAVIYGVTIKVIKEIIRNVEEKS